MKYYLSVLIKQVSHSVCAKMKIAYLTQEQVENKASISNDAKTSEHARNSHARCFCRRQEESLFQDIWKLYKSLRFISFYFIDSCTYAN